MPYVLVAIAVVLVFAIAAGTVGREAHRLDAVAPRAVYVIAEAVEFVADRLPEHVQARVTPAELAELLTVHVNRFHNRGLAPGDVIDRTQDITSPLFVDEIDEVAFVLGEADKRQIDVTDEDVAIIIEQHLVYFDTIGAVGPRADRLDG